MSTRRVHHRPLLPQQVSLTHSQRTAATLASTPVGVAVQNERAPQGEILGIHVASAQLTFIGKSDPHVGAVLSALKQMLEEANKGGDEYGRGSARTARPRDVRVGNVNYRVKLEYKMGRGAGAASTATPKVTASVNGQVGTARALYPSDFKQWVSYDSPWVVA